MLAGIFNGARRDGVWQARSQETVIAIFGGVRLDYTRAILPPGSVSIRIFTLFGGVTIRVPRGSVITQEGFALFGGFAVNRQKDATMLDPREAPSFFVTGAALFGGVGVDEA